MRISVRSLTLLAVFVSIASGSALAATSVADSRGAGMGNTGVASADYLVAPYYNPALTANYRQSDDVALLLPAISASLRDSDETLKEVDDLQDTIDAFKASPSASNIAKLNTHLDNLDGDKPLTVTANAGIAVAIPNDKVAINVFSRGYVEVIGVTDIAAFVSDSQADTETRYENSKVELAAFGYTEVGIAFAKKIEIEEDQSVLIGLSPKYQQLKTYYESVTVEEFDLDDYDKSERKENAFNLDLGAVWQKEQWRLGVSIKDLFKQSIKTQNPAIKYELTPQVTVGGAYATQLFTAALDADLTKQSRYNNVDDDTQFVRMGIEGNAWDWAQLRVGYQIDVKNTLDNSITAGIGISPFDVVNIDLAGSYADSNEFGASANLALTF
ncbi:conjugal transfer protein TraF [Vibrio sp. MACH09]|uniref:conjugal transfer protein TraF n=1 Tax=Vibrio sp. MACH09 TaxID=3025122 RepID=UPI00295EA347|nr:conjugal transfer protein TraF [Vibrio sp. MACH09]